MELIPGLPRDLALQCLIRLPFNQFYSFVSVCKGWKAEIEQPGFLELRKSTGKAQTLVVLSLAQVNPTRSRDRLDVPVCRPVVFEPETGCWSEMPPLPRFSNGLPLFCQMVAVGSDLVVMGGYDPMTWECLNSVFVFNFLSSTWRRGAGMPGGPRSLFGCAADGDRTVFIAGGHDGEKNALRSGWAYDVASDNWIQLPDMAEERDECKGVFHRGKFHVIGGYPTDMQGHFNESIEIFDTITQQWSKTDDVLSKAIKAPRICVEGSDQRMYTCHEGDMIAQEDDNWQFVARLPADVANTPYLISVNEKLLLIGTSKYGEPQGAYTMDLNTWAWTKVHVPLEYSGHVQSGCYLII